jgi:hypothetical protein
LFKKVEKNPVPSSKRFRRVRLGADFRGTALATRGSGLYNIRL